MAIWIKLKAALGVVPHSEAYAEPPRTKSEVLEDRLRERTRKAERAAELSAPFQELLARRQARLSADQPLE
jgi:hypothetical protein